MRKFVGVWLVGRRKIKEIELHGGKGLSTVDNKIVKSSNPYTLRVVNSLTTIIALSSVLNIVVYLLF